MEYLAQVLRNNMVEFLSSLHSPIYFDAVTDNTFFEWKQNW